MVYKILNDPIWEDVMELVIIAIMVAGFGVCLGYLIELVFRLFGGE